MFNILMFIFTLFHYVLIPNKESVTSHQSLWEITPQTSSKTQEIAVIELIRRLLPSRVNEFEIHVNPSLLYNDYRDKFIIQSMGTKISITGTSGVAAANGFNYYLKYFANCHVSWSGDQLNVPSPLPIVKNPIYMTIQDKFRYYQNVCTASYSFVWWEWKRWEREIDWMALRGINFPLAFNGQEIIWRKVFQKFGLTLEEIDDYFSGPAFLAWNRMGNFQKWSGPLTEHWHISQLKLQKQILKRMRDFGMIPILPAFAGHVPKNITRVYPNAKVSKLTPWGGFNESYCCTSFLEPDDPLFIKIGGTFIDMYRNEFGTEHFYNADLFNEMIPKTMDIKYLSDCGKAVYDSIAIADPKAVWVMQGWIFYKESFFWKEPQTKALLTSVPQGKMIVLDLWSETFPVFQNFDGYYGQPWIWCMLHNYGGVLGLYGSFNTLNSDVFKARLNYSNMIGIGLTPEGIEQNDVIYDFMMELIWYNSSVDLNKWVSDYAVRRYGTNNTHLIEAWKILKKSVYTDPIKTKNHGKYVYVLRPNLHGKSPLWYDPNDLTLAMNLFYKTINKELMSIETFRYDLIDIVRQFLQITFDNYYDKVIESYKASDISNFESHSYELLSVLDNLEEILSHDEHFRLEKSIKSAKSLANTDEERRFNEYNARNQITLWGPEDMEGTHLDYANKQWSGMISHYYKPRWELFINYLRKSLTYKKPFKQMEYNYDVFKNVECPFVHSNETFSFTENGDDDDDILKIVENIFKKYK